MDSRFTHKPFRCKFDHLEWSLPLVCIRGGGILNFHFVVIRLTDKLRRYQNCFLTDFLQDFNFGFSQKQTKKTNTNAFRNGRIKAEDPPSLN